MDKFRDEFMDFQQRETKFLQIVCLQEQVFYTKRSKRDHKGIEKYKYVNLNS